MTVGDFALGGSFRVVAEHPGGGDTASHESDVQAAFAA
jgi:hypothetical protein